MIMKVDKFVKGAVRQFAYWFAHGTIGSGLLNSNSLKTLEMP